MSEVIRSKTKAFAACTGESFGQWVDGQRPAGGNHKSESSPQMTQQGLSDPPTQDDVAAVRSYRAGTGGSMDSVSCVSGAGGSSSSSPIRPKAGGKITITESVFVTPTRSTALVLAALMAMGIVATYGINGDLSDLDHLKQLEMTEKDILDHNYTRNLLIQHLARGKDGKIAHLRGYAEQIDEIGSHTGPVVIFTPADGDQKPVVATLPELRQRIENDIEQIETWNPPPLLKAHPHMSFTTADLWHDTLPAGGTLLLALVALAFWSAMSLRNLPALHSSTRLKFGRTPLFWLVPPVNLYMPLVVMRDLWNGSDPAGLTDPDGLHLPVIGMWWLIFVGAVGVFVYATYRMLVAEGVFMMNEAGRFALYADIGLLALACVTFVIVAAISWNQSRRIGHVADLEAKLGPRNAWQRGNN